MKKILIILCIASVLLNIISKFSKVFATSEITLSDSNMDGTVIVPDNFVDNYYVIAFGIVNGVGYRAAAVSPNPIRLKVDVYSFGTFAYFASGQYGFANAGSRNGITPSTMPNYLQEEINIASTNYNPTGTLNDVSIPQYDHLVIYSNAVVKDQNDNTIPTQTPTPSITYPELLNNNLTLENLSFQSYNISAGDYEDDTFYALFYDRSVLQDNFWDYPQVIIELSPDNKYWLEGDTTQKYKIPITDVPLTYKADTTYSIAFATKQYSSSGGGFRDDDFTWEFLGSPRSWTTLSSSGISTDLDNLNNETDKQNLINYQNNVTNNLSNIYGSLTGTDTTDNDNTLAQSGVITENNQDITSSGFDNIFNMFYNGITANPVDIVLPIPFTQQTITIQPDYIRNALGTNNIILNLIESFWYFAVSLYIVKDIESLIRKMKNGDVATSSDTNIKADML